MSVVWREGGFTFVDEIRIFWISSFLNLLSPQMAPQQKSGIAVGLNKGHITTRRELKQKPSTRQGASKRTTFVRNIVREVAGFAPYERRVMELIKNSKDKRAKKLTKKRLGTFLRSKKKIDELTNVIALSRRS
ncbi:ribosomal protein L36e-domain-containing protein [Absidia repens]|uniref:60S ribosomal protein L36 n=2 Tax=Absidia repens TaxID=90262 RepID=A0A1X2IHK2_9FUNG|nr:ribosomal protein L36e-domain-containing protein [Absidia repens]